MAVHKQNKQSVVDFLRQIDLSTDETSIYMLLLAHGPQTVLEISRSLSTGRTKLYPILTELADKGLVLVSERHFGTAYQAAEPASIEHLVAAKELAGQAARSQFPAVLHALEQIKHASPIISKAETYHGVESCKQIAWNQALSHEPYRIMLDPRVQQLLGARFTNKWGAEAANGRIICNRKIKLPAKAEFMKISSYQITRQLYIYGDRVGIIEITSDGMKGTEIQSLGLAHQQAEFFDLLWNQAS